jgi:hypothetical protein
MQPPSTSTVSAVGIILSPSNTCRALIAIKRHPAHRAPEYACRTPIRARPTSIQHQASSAASTLLCSARNEPSYRPGSKGGRGTAGLHTGGWGDGRPRENRPASRAIALRPPPADEDLAVCCSGRSIVLSDRRLWLLPLVRSRIFQQQPSSSHSRTSRSSI